MAQVSVAQVFACVLSLFAVASPSCLRNQPVHHSVLVKRAQMHMGTLVTITAVAKTEPAAQAAITAGFEEIRRLEQLLSTWIQSSDLSKVNLAAGREPVKVSPETVTLLKRSLEVADLTGGAFSIAIGPAVDAWGFSRQPRVPDEMELVSLRKLVDLSQVALDEPSSTVFLKRSGMRLDVGGIGKGFTADRAVVRCRARARSAGSWHSRVT